MLKRLSHAKSISLLILFRERGAGAQLLIVSFWRTGFLHRGISAVRVNPQGDLSTSAICTCLGGVWRWSQIDSLLTPLSDNSLLTSFKIVLLPFICLHFIVFDGSLFFLFEIFLFSLFNLCKPPWAWVWKPLERWGINLININHDIEITINGI